LRHLIAIVIAATLAGCAPPRAQRYIAPTLVKTEIVPKHRVRLADLVGLSPAAVQQKLTGLAVAWPTPMGLEISSPDGALAFANLGEWMSDDDGHEIGRRGVDHADGMPAAFASCDARYANPKDAPMAIGVDVQNGHIIKTLVKETLAWQVALEFRNGRFIQAWRPSDEPRKPGGPTLESGAGFTRTWERQPLGADVALDITCWRRTPVGRPDAGAGRHADLAGDLQGLAAVPPALGLPALNARRADAMRDGAAIYDQLTPGSEVPGGVEAFTAKHPVIVVRPGADPRYRLLQVDMGSYTGRNQTYFHHEALIGVWEGRVLFRTRIGQQAIEGLGREMEYQVADPQSVVG
jgi:hypothetical protein